MKQLAIAMFLLLLSGEALAGIGNQLDSLRKVVLAPKIIKYQSEVEEFTKLINATNDKTQIRFYAKQIIEISNVMYDNIKELYGVRTKASMQPIYVGEGSSSVLYSNIGGFIYPVINVKVGSMPDVGEEVDYIKEYAWKLRLALNTEMVKRNVININKRNSELRNI